jgi:hypothetical protein
LRVKMAAKAKKTNAMGEATPAAEFTLDVLVAVLEVVELVLVVVPVLVLLPVVVVELLAAVVAEVVEAEDPELVDDEDPEIVEDATELEAVGPPEITN